MGKLEVYDSWNALKRRFLPRKTCEIRVYNNELLPIRVTRHLKGDLKVMNQEYNHNSFAKAFQAYSGNKG